MNYTPTIKEVEERISYLEKETYDDTYPNHQSKELSWLYTIQYLLNNNIEFSVPENSVRSSILFPCGLYFNPNATWGVLGGGKQYRSAGIQSFCEKYLAKNHAQYLEKKKLSMNVNDRFSVGVDYAN